MKDKTAILWSDIIRNIKKEARHFKKYKWFNTIYHLNEYHILRYAVRKDTQEAYNNYVEHSVKGDPRQFWSFVHNKRYTTRIPGTMYLNGKMFNEQQKVVDKITEFFRSVYSVTSQAFSPLFSLEGHYLYNDPITMEPFTKDHILFTAKRLLNKFTRSTDLIHSFLVKDCATVFLSRCLFQSNFENLYISWTLGDISNPRV